MLTRQASRRVAALVAAVAIPLVFSAATVGVKGPPWVSVEYPVNPYDRSTRDAFLLVHAFHHGTPTQFPVRGTAEGLVNGQRRSVSLDFTETTRPGVYALRRQWGTEGVWTLVISVAPSQQDVAQALVEIAPTGEVTAVRVPTRKQGDWLVPRAITPAEIDAALRGKR